MRMHCVKKSLYSYSKKSFALRSESLKLCTKMEEHLDPKAYPFLSSTITGFLPRTTPIMKLPSKYDTVNSLLDRMRWNQPDGSQGLLAKKQFGDAVKSELSEINMDGVEEDMMLTVALFRDYSFLTSAYLLEECHHNYLKSGTYGLGRDVLPASIAKPFKQLADKLSLRPFMEYNSCYASTNFFKKDPSKDVTINNIDIYRSFINMKSEAGFILVHIAINQHGGMLIRSGVDVLRGAETKNREMFNEALKEMATVMKFMNEEFERMYLESNPDDYNVFRTFIMGISNQPMFPKGVVYEGCYDDKPQFFRGESGANDSIIPFCDNILQITETIPQNPLTQILREFRTYRPKTQQEFLAWSEEVAREVGVLEFAKQDPTSMYHLLQVADQVRAFRHRHWVLTNMYIIFKSKHPIATGGSPITTWLSNQLVSVISFIKANAKFIPNGTLPSYAQYNLDKILSRCDAEESIVREETDKRRKTYNQ